MNSPAKLGLDEDVAASGAGMLLPAEGLQLHLGSGPHVEPGWLNVDKSWTARVSRRPLLVRILARTGALGEEQLGARWPHEVIQRDLSRGLPWEDCTCRAIYSSHMVEHFERAEARRLLADCLRVLKPGGVVRLALPDLHAAVRHYLENKAAGDELAADKFVGAHFFASYDNRPRAQRFAIRLLHRPHQWMYDAESMQALLVDVGFSHVRECDYGVGTCPDLPTLETRKDEVFEGSSFYVEGFKP